MTTSWSTFLVCSRHQDIAADTANQKLEDPANGTVMMASSSAEVVSARQQGYA
jgi:hypothetical protein